MYQKPHGVTWSVSNMYDKYYTYLSEKIECEYKSPTCIGYGSPNSPHMMTIKNNKTNKYFVISYWDHAGDVYMEEHGWDVNNMIEYFTSCGVKHDIKFTPFSYMAYSMEFEEFSKNITPFDEKPNNELMFRGFLYGFRKSLFNLNEIIMTEEKLNSFDYFNELTNNKICVVYDD